MGFFNLPHTQQNRNIWIATIKHLIQDFHFVLFFNFSCFQNIVDPLQMKMWCTSVQSSSNPVSSARHLLIPLQEEGKLHNITCKNPLQDYLWNYLYNSKVGSQMFSEEIHQFRSSNEPSRPNQLNVNCRPASPHNSREEMAPSTAPAMPRKSHKN